MCATILSVDTRREVAAQPESMASAVGLPNENHRLSLAAHEKGGKDQLAVIAIRRHFPRPGNLLFKSIRASSTNRETSCFPSLSNFVPLPCGHSRRRLATIQIPLSHEKNARQDQLAFAAC